LVTVLPTILFSMILLLKIADTGTAVTLFFFVLILIHLRVGLL